MTTPAVSPRKVAKNTVSQLVSLVLAGASKALAAVLVARYLGPDGLGVFSLSWTLAGTLSFLAVFGLDYRLIREMARDNDRRELEVSFTLACVLALGVAVLLAALPLLTGARHHITESLSGAAAYVALSGPVLMLRAAFHSQERMELESIGTIVEGVLSIAAVGWTLSAGFGVPGAMLGLAVGRLGNLLVSLILFKREWGALRPRWETERWSRLLRVATPMAVTYAFTAVYMRFDVVILSALRSATEVGLYGAASVVILTVPILASAFNGSLYPVLSRAGSAEDPALVKVFDQTVRLLFLASIPIAVGLMILAHEVIQIVYGAGFGRAAVALMILSPILPLRFLNNLLGHVLTAVDRQNKRTRSVMVAAGVNLALTAALIPALGFMGAVVATLLTEVLLTALMVPAIRPLRVGMQGVAEGAAISIVMGTIVLLVPGGVIVRMAVGATVVAAALMALFVSGLRLRLSLRPKGHAPQAPTTISRGFRLSGTFETHAGGGVMASTRSVPAGDVTRFSVVGGLNIRVEGLDSPAGAYASRIFAGMPPATSERDDLTFVFEPGVQRRGRRLPPLNAGADPEGIWVADHLNRAAVLSFGDLSRPIRIDDRMAPRAFTNWVYHPVLRAALWSRRSILMRAAGAGVNDRRVAVTGWAETGKSTLVFELLRRGHRFLADDWLALTPAGIAGPISTQVDVRDGQRPYVDPDRWPGRRSILRPRFVRATEGLSKAASSAPNLSAGLHKVSQAVWRAGWLKSDLARLFPEAGVSEPGNLDLLVVLTDPGLSVPRVSDVPERLAAAIAGELGHPEMEAAYRFAHPGSLGGPLFPRFEAARDHLQGALIDTQIVIVPFVPRPEDVALVADVIEQFTSGMGRHVPAPAEVPVVA